MNTKKNKITTNQAITIAKKCAVIAIRNYTSKNCQPVIQAISDSIATSNNATAETYLNQKIKYVKQYTPKGKVKKHRDGTLNLKRVETVQYTVKTGSAPSIDADDLKQDAILAVLELFNDNDSITVEDVKAVAYKAVNARLYNSKKHSYKSIYIEDYETDSAGNTTSKIVDRNSELRTLLFEHEQAYNNRISDFLGSLTDKQKKVLYMLSKGYNPNKIADLLDLGFTTIIHRIEQLRKKANEFFTADEKSDILHSFCNVYTPTQYTTKTTATKKPLEMPCIIRQANPEELAYYKSLKK